MGNSLPVVKIVKVGTTYIAPSEQASNILLQIKRDLGIGGGSTVTLIEADRRILVDTGFDYECLDTPVNDQKNAGNLIWCLKDLDMVPDDIDVVFITHWHKDHFGNLGIFNKAERLAPNGIVERFGLKDFRGIENQEEITSGVRMILTPGHTIDHASLTVNTVAGGISARVTVAGDAVISHGYFDSGRIWQYNADFFSVEKARQSLIHLIDVSDIIIPGHGAPFMAYKPPWIKSKYTKTQSK